MEWLQKNTLLIGYYKKQHINFDNDTISSFDLDHTLIRPKIIKGKSRTFPNNKDPHDWEFHYANVKNVLNKLIKKNRIIIYTNQSNILNHVNIWKEKIENIAKQLNLPFEIYVSTEHDKYRKPLTFGWSEFIKGNKETSFYCGDAMGRKGIYVTKGNKPDHSSCDLMFAKNLKIAFKTPEDIFKNIKIVIPEIEYKIPTLCSTIPDDVISCLSNLPQKLNIIINVGFPGSGKSYFSNMFLKMLKYKIINQDKLKTLAKCKKEACIQLEKNRNIVIDNTNVSKNTRHEWVLIGKKYKADVVIVHFNTPVTMCKHNNIFRNIITNGKQKIIPTIAYNIANKYFELPSTNELVSGNVPNINENVKKIYTIEPYYMINSTSETVLYTQYLHT